MNVGRFVQKQLSIFDIINYHSLDFPGKKSIRVMYEYDRLDNKQVFTVLNREIPAEAAKRIVTWLEENTETEDLIYGLDFNEIDFRIPKKTIKERFLDA